MLLTVIIPAYNEEHEIGLCIESLLSAAEGKIVEIIVVDNASSDRTAAVAQNFDKVRVIFEPKKGPGYARQRGLETARGDLLAFFDADVRLPNGWASRVKSAFEKHPQAIGLSGPYRYHDGPKWRRRLLYIINIFGMYISLLLFGGFVISGNFVARKAALQAMGGFDGKITFYDDADITRRLAQEGQLICDSGLFVYTSSRRFDDGLVKVNLLYVLNFCSVFLLGTPFSKRSKDIRRA